jgi:hypothetical protein
MKPTPSQVHVNQPLSILSIAFMQSLEGFVADKVFPVVPVDKQSDLYYEYARGDWNRNQMRKRAPGSESAGGVYSVSNTPYMCDVFGLHKDIPDQLRANADSIFQLDSEGTEFLSRQALLHREIEFSTNFFKAGVWTTNITGVASGPGANQVLHWNDPASTPIENIREAKRAMQLLTGLKPNKLTIGAQVWDKLVDHPDVLDRIKHSAGNDRPAIVTKQAFAALVELEEILVMESIQNTAGEGLADSNAFVGGKRALLTHSPARAGLMTASAGYTFAWRGYLGGTQASAISRFRLERNKVDRLEIEAAFDQKRVAADLGYFWDTIVA